MLNENLKTSEIKKIHVTLSEASYDIYIGRNLLQNVNDYFNLDRKVLIITDDHIPDNYVNAVKSNIKNSIIFKVPNGEENKNFDNYQQILKTLVENNFTRTDALLAIGGGMVGDLSGIVASTFMRGIDLYNIPTTLLSQVDSSIGGKTAIDFMHVKNIVGSFFQPKAVLIDVETLKSLPDRQIKNGLVESIKMASTFDKDFFDYLTTMPNILNNAEEIIYKSLLLKKDVVEKDEKEKNIRRVLNFGHTIGHAIEETMNLKLLHGECVGIGMLYFSSDEVKNKLRETLEKYKLPTSCDFDKEKVLELIKHDKKASGDTIATIHVNEIGTYDIVKMTIPEISKLLV
ncbi:MAG: 3-dehydroquinate synthase [Lachnospiraceae bacterium]|nr:3-dehydroquinate synthase [Lachnospiraceae bacterium]